MLKYVIKFCSIENINKNCCFSIVIEVIRNIIISTDLEGVLTYFLLIYTFVYLIFKKGNFTHLAKYHSYFYDLKVSKEKLE